MSQYNRLETPSIYPDEQMARPRRRFWLGAAAAAALLIGAVEFGSHLLEPAAPPAPPPPSVAVSEPLQRDVAQQLSFLGQFAAVKRVEIRAQVGGTLTSVNFKDGDVVQQGQLLFQVDPVPFQIKVDLAKAELASATARLALAAREAVRAQQLRATDAGSAENVDQKVEEKAAAEAALDGAKASLRDAQFDLDRTRVYAPFTGRIGTHLVSVGNLIAGSRAASSPTTLLTTLVSLDPIWLNFDMSESDYLTFERQRARLKGPLADKIEVSLSDEDKFTHGGTLDFIDNSLDRASGTIHARATLQNSDALLTPGGFGRVRLAVSSPAPALLVPDAAVLADQGDHSVYVIGEGNVVTLKKVEIGALHGGLRVIRGGLVPTDKIAIDGIPSIRAGAPITPKAGEIRFDSEQE
jgi:RND family efflux transporter MFP subunit